MGVVCDAREWLYLHGHSGLSPRYLDSSDLALSLSQATKGLLDPVTRFLKYLPISIIFIGVIELSRWENGNLPQFHWLDLVVTIPSLFVASRYKNLVGTNLIWDCLDRPLTIGILNTKICYRKMTIITKLDFCNN